MSALDTMMRLQAGYNGQEMEGINQLSQTLGGIIQGGGQRDYRRAAINFFKDGNISPERIQEFTSMYPGVDPVETFQIAGAVAKQAKAQKMKDFVKSLGSAVSNGGEMDEKTLMPLISNSGLDPAEAMQFLQHASTAGLNFKAMNSAKKNAVALPANASLWEKNEKGEYVKKAEGVQTEEKRTPLDKAIMDKMKETNPDTGKTYTAAEAYSLLAHPVQPKEDTEKVVDLGDRVEIRKGGKTIETKPKGKLPGSDPDSKPKRVPYRDTVTGAVNYYDVNNPKDRETLQKFGAQLQAVAENPMAPVLREALTPGASSKVLDATRAAEYLKKAGGDKEKARKAAKADGYAF